MDTPDLAATVPRDQLRFVRIMLTIAFTIAELVLWKIACLKLNWRSPHFISYVYPLGMATVGHPATLFPLIFPVCIINREHSMPW